MTKCPGCNKGNVLESLRGNDAILTCDSCTYEMILRNVVIVRTIAGQRTIVKTPVFTCSQCVKCGQDIVKGLYLCEKCGQDAVTDLYLSDVDFEEDWFLPELDRLESALAYQFQGHIYLRDHWLWKHCDLDGFGLLYTVLEHEMIHAVLYNLGLREYDTIDRLLNPVVLRGIPEHLFEPPGGKTPLPG